MSDDTATRNLLPDEDDERPFDYTVTFPTAYNAVLKSSSPVEPVVFLFGWAGCQDRHLAKYSEVYERSGCVTVRYTAELKFAGAREAARRRVGERLADLLDELDLTDNVLFAHAFSNNGCRTLSAFCAALHARRETSRLRGVVFDSSPAIASPYQSALAVSYALFPPNASTWTKLLFLVAFTVYSSIKRAYIWLRSIVDPAILLREFVYHSLARRSLPLHQLYLYSTADAICNSEKIDAFRSTQEQRGARVTSKCWPDSAHCEHMRLHDDEYRRQVVDFICAVLEDVDSTNGDFEHVDKPL